MCPRSRTAVVTPQRKARLAERSRTEADDDSERDEQHTLIRESLCEIAASSLKETSAALEKVARPAAGGARLDGLLEWAQRRGDDDAEAHEAGARQCPGDRALPRPVGSRPGANTDPS